MQLKNLVTLALASSVSAQTPSLADALASQNSTLSSLNSLLLSQPSLVQALSSAQNITILAPSNDALAAFLNSSAAASVASPSAIAALLTYHVLNGTNYASSFGSSSRFIRTLLTDPNYTNVTNGQRVQATNNGSVVFYSGLRDASTVVTPNVNFTGGTIHIINRVLSIPPTINATLRAANLTALVGAVQFANLTAPLAALSNVTIFAPTNEAFNAIGSLAPNLTAQVVAPLLQYHVIPNTLGYSSVLQNGTLTTANGQTLTITIINGTVFVNSAKVVTPNVLVANGVVHVIDNVLNPANSTAAPNPAATSNPPAFSGATTGTAGIPFTSGIPAPTTTAPVATQRPTTTAPPNAAMPMRTGAAGAAVLFGGAALWANL